MRAGIGLALWLAAAGASAQLPERFVRAPLTEVAVARIGADVVAETDGLRGAGVTVCVVDTGIDSGHPRVGEARGYDAVARAEVEPSDRHGHGTAMASIVRAVAPEAALVAADAWDAERGGFPDEAVVEAARFCRASVAGPLVILLALGGHDGPHDGRGAFERALIRAADGAPLVAAAGNDGERAVRAAGRVLAGETARVEVRVPRPAVDAPELGLSLAFRPDGGAAAWRVDGSEWQPGVRSFEMEADGRRHAVAPDGEDPRVARLRTVGALETFHVEVRGPASFELFLSRARLGPTFLPAGLAGPWARTDEVVTVPATAPAIVAVGATVSRPERVGRPLETRAGAAAFSSVGPTSSGHPKPDLVAPGGWILAALSRDLEPGDDENLLGGRTELVADDGRVAVRGTSAAAALVAGALALMLERDPSRAGEARALLAASASGETWTPSRGWGELDVVALRDAWDGRLTRAPSLTYTRRYVPTDEALQLTARGGPLTLRRGARVWTFHPSAGLLEPRFDPGPAFVGAPLRFEVTHGRGASTLDVPVVLDRSPRGPVLPSGGCAVGAPASARWPIAALLVAATLRLRRRR